MNITKEYLTGGNAKFTISNPAGVTLDYVLHPGAGNNLDGRIRIYVKQGATRKYLGRVNEVTGICTHSSRSCLSSYSLEWQVIKWVCNVAWRCVAFPDGYTVEILEGDYVPC